MNTEIMNTERKNMVRFETEEGWKVSGSTKSE
jgi:hypothetical protein